jgi:hypothetical protein
MCRTHALSWPTAMCSSLLRVHPWSLLRISPWTAPAEKLLCVFQPAAGPIRHALCVSFCDCVLQVPKAVDTNGAGDTFATMYMIAAMRGDPSPGSTASWAASRAVLQPQTCKPRCAPQLITAPGGLPVLGQLEKGWIAAVPLAQHIAGVAAGFVGRLADLAPAVPELRQAAEWLQDCSRRSGWGRDFSSRLGSAAITVESAGMTWQRVEPSAAGGADKMVAAAAAVPQSARAGVQQQ